MENERRIAEHMPDESCDAAGKICESCDEAGKICDAYDGKRSATEGKICDAVEKSCGEMCVRERIEALRQAVCGNGLSVHGEASANGDLPADQEASANGGPSADWEAPANGSSLADREASTDSSQSADQEAPANGGLSAVAGTSESGALKGDLWVSPDGLCALYQARSAGFCFGVRRAVDTVYEQIEKGIRPIYTYGPIIHNEVVVRDLEEKGVRVIQSVEELRRIRSGTVIIRSHGVGRDIYSIIENNGLRVVDATCPFVKKIHRIVEQKGKEGAEVIIIGSASHPEVQGIRGWSTGEVTVIETEEEARSFVPRTDKPLCVVSQTTFNLKKFHKFVEIMKGLRYHEFAVLNTICNATEERQTEARSIARIADVMFVIGGKHSSNTQKLYEICRKECHSTFFVQTFDDLNLRLVPFRGIVGISAGASTPNILIEEVSNLCRKTILSRC